MAARVNLVTLGVADVAASTAFYESVGFVRSSGSTPEVSFFRAGPVVLGVWGRDELAGDAGLDDPGGVPRGVALAMNLGSEAEVDQVWQSWVDAGATPLKRPERVFWGGYSSYVADRDGHMWEFAYNPYWPINADGWVDLPE